MEARQKKYRVIFFGTSEFAVPILERLARDGRLDVALVVTQPDRPTGRTQTVTAPPVKVAAGILDIPTADISIFRDREKVMQRPDVAVIAAYGRIIKQDIIDLPLHGTVNVHPSLLPRYRGPAPIQTAIANGDAETGVTIMQVDAEMDHGPILAQRRVPVGPSDSSPALTAKLAEVGAELLVETLIPYLEGRAHPIEQDHARATYTKLLERDDGRVDAAMSPAEIERRFRAYQPWPGIWTEYRDGKRTVRVKIIGMDNTLFTRVQPEGKREMTYAEFLRGYPRGLEIQARADG